MKFQLNLSKIVFDPKAWEKAVGVAGDKQLKQLVDEFVTALTSDPYGTGPGVPVWTGQAKSSIVDARSSQGSTLKSLAPSADASIQPSPSALKRGANFIALRQSRGRSQGFFEFVTPENGGPALGFRFSFRSVVPHYITNENTDPGIPGLIKPTPWETMRKVTAIVRTLWNAEVLAKVIPNPADLRFYKFPKVR